MLYPHVVNNCVKKHVNIPTYSMSEENVLLNEYPVAQTINPYISYQTPGMWSMPYQQPAYPGQMAQYQGNVGTEPFQQQMFNKYPISQFPGMNVPYNY